MSEAVLEMYLSLDEEHKFEVDEFIRKVAQKQALKDRDFIAEFEKLRGSISEEDAEIKTPFKRDLSEFIGCISEEDANAAYEALAECRKIDYGEW